jgi:triosephosphate isomerase
VSKLICGNWKMNLGPEAAQSLVESIVPVAVACKSTRIWVAPPVVSIAAAVKAAGSSGIKIGAQNCHWDEAGAFTGEISVPMVKEVGAEFVIVGHSERRTIFQETEEQIARKAEKVLNSSLFLILCVGESIDERKRGETAAVLEQQLRRAISGRTEREIASLVVAYEPIWAIGSGVTASAPQIEQAHKVIRDTLRDYSKLVRPPIIYGGSVTPENLGEILRISEVDGALVGGASLNPEKFTRMVELADPL